MSIEELESRTLPRFFKRPPVRVVDNLVKNFEKYRDEGGLQTKHPWIPTNYTDSEDGRVINEVTGRLIKKENSVLTNRGTFIYSGHEDIVSCNGGLELPYLVNMVRMEGNSDYKYIRKGENGIVYNREDLMDPEVRIKYKVFLTDLELSLSQFDTGVKTPEFEDVLVKGVEENDFLLINKDHTNLGGFYLDISGLSAKDKELLIRRNSLTREELIKEYTKDPDLFFFNEPYFNITRRTLVTKHSKTTMRRRVLEECSTCTADSGIFTVGPLGYLDYRNPKKVKRNIPTENEEGRILNYMAKAPDLKKSFLCDPTSTDDIKKPLYLGLEWEVLPKDTSREALIRWIATTPYVKDHLIMKYDRSIDRSGGFELCTVPATLNIHKQVLEELFLTGIPRSFYSGIETGIHVHIDRAFFSKMSLGKFMGFINKKTNESFIEVMAGRPFNYYSQKVEPGEEPTIGLDKSSLLYKKRTWHNSAVNTNLPSTIELRIFSSTNSKKNLFRKLEFTDALVRFTSTASYSLQQMDVPNFVEYVFNNKKKYRDLVLWLGYHGYLERKIVKVKNTTKSYFKYNQPKKENIRCA